MPPITLKSPVYNVVMGDWTDPDSWVATEVQSIGRDLQMAETLFARHKQWGKISENGIKLQAVAAYYAMKRTGNYTASWEQFENEYLEVAEVDDADDEVGPTNREADDD